MSDYTKMAVVAGAALLAGVGIWATCREKPATVRTAPVAQAPVKDPAPTKTATASERESLKEVNVTREPVVTDTVFGLYRKITAALAAGGLNQEGDTPVITVMSLLDETDGINTLLYHPEKLISVQSTNPYIRVFVDEQGHAGDMILVIAYRDLSYSLLMRDETHFVAAGPLLDNVSSMGYLQILLETLIDQWKI